MLRSMYDDLAANPRTSRRTQRSEVAYQIRHVTGDELGWQTQRTMMRTIACIDFRGK